MRKMLSVFVCVLLLAGLSASALSCSKSTKQSDIEKAEQKQKRAEAELEKTKKELAAAEAALAQARSQAGTGGDTKSSDESGKSHGSATYTPPRGSAERKAILDVARSAVGWKKLFKVNHLKVKDGWAYAELEGYDPAHPDWKTEPLYELARKGASGWKVLFAGDATYLPEGYKGEVKDWLQQKYPSAPAEIFE